MKLNNTNITTGFRVFLVFNYLLMILMAFMCLFPILHVFAVSLSSSLAVSSGWVKLFPVEFTTAAYEYLIKTKDFWISMWVSVKRIVLGGAVNMLLTVCVAYPLSRDSDAFPARKRYVAYFLFTMLFGGGLIPTFLVVRYTGLLDSIWALIIPGAVPIYNCILLMNFFRQLPKEMEEAAFIDGAGHWTTLWKICLPTSLPALATIGLFTVVGHWNEWFSAILYMRRASNYPLQTYLRSVLITSDFKVTSYQDVEILHKLSNRTVSAAQIFVGMVPILSVYPFLQKHFTKGIVLGSVKG